MLLRHLRNRSNLWRAAKTALVVGPILTLINQTSIAGDLLRGAFPPGSVSMRIGLTFLVPFLVSLVSSGLADRKREGFAGGDLEPRDAAGGVRVVRGERDVVLVIADISGYTGFMVANREELAHSQQIIGALLESVLQEVEIPLEIAKFEGDAVFLYLARQDDGGWPTELIAVRLPRFFAAFRSRLHSLGPSLTCGCGACANAAVLRLKVVVHAGTALFYEIAGRTELAGVDVIVVHRLLKNSITADEYVLLSESAARHLHLTLDAVGRSTEHYGAIGAVDVTAYAAPYASPRATT